MGSRLWMNGWMDLANGWMSYHPPGLSTQLYSMSSRCPHDVFSSPEEVSRLTSSTTEYTSSFLYLDIYPLLQSLLNPSLLLPACVPTVSAYLHADFYSNHIHTYMPDVRVILSDTYLAPYLPTHLFTNLPTYIPTYQSTNPSHPPTTAYF